MGTATVQKTITYADYLKIEDGNRYEVFNGDLIMVPAPTLDHQFISKKLVLLLDPFVTSKMLGNVAYAPVDVVFDDETVLQPDILFVKSDNTNILRKESVQGAPDLIVEIISPSSTFYDTVEEKEVYRKHGVSEYWIVFPEEKVIEVLTLENGEYVEFSNSRKDGFVESNIISGLKIDSNEVFNI